MSDRWDVSATVDAVTVCEETIKQSLVSQSSFDTTSRWDLHEDEETGQATIERDFDATNGFGAAISNRYRCVVDYDTRQIVTLAVRDGTGWRRLI